MGAIELSTMNVVSCRPDYVNAETTVAFFAQLKVAYRTAPKIHIILDRSGYHRSQLVREQALEKNIELHFFTTLQSKSQLNRAAMEGHE